MIVFSKVLLLISNCIFEIYQSTYAINIVLLGIIIF